MNSKTILLLLLLLPATTFLNFTKPVTTSKEPEILPVALSGKITMSGAYALYPMAVKWAEEFKKINPGVTFDIQGGGAGKGMTDVLSGTVHFGMVSRDISPEEVKKGAYGIAVCKLGRERGITIVAKNVSINYKDVKINIIDTPGHADFGGEVERVLTMADGVLLLVDAFEGPMPQARFVLQKALALGLKPILVINKVDKENCRPDEVHEAVFDLFFHLDATEDQLHFPTQYGSSKHGWMSTDWKKETEYITPLLDAILEYVPPAVALERTPQMLITSLDYSSFVGRIAFGKIFRGVLKENMPVSLVKRNGQKTKKNFSFPQSVDRVILLTGESGNGKTAVCRIFFQIFKK